MASLPSRPSLPSLMRRGIRAGSALAQRVPNGAWTSVAGRVPGVLGAHADFVRAKANLSSGVVPDDLHRVATRLLRAADRAMSMRARTLAVELFDEALQLAYHPSVHHSPQGSALARDAESFLAPFRASSTARLLQIEADPATPPHPGGSRVLVVSHGSWTFIDRVVSQIKHRDDIDVRVLDLTTLPAADRPSHRAAVRARAHLALTGTPLPVPESLREHLQGIDTLFVEWGTYAFAWLSLLDLGDVRLICRLHRFEAFTPYPSLARFSRVDDMLFISPSVRELVRAQAPRLEQAHRVSTVRNPHDYSPFTPEKDPGYEKTILQVGWAIGVKDVLFTLDVLEALRQDDPEWTLLLVGPEPPDKPEARDAEFVATLRGRIAALGDAVRILGKRDDVPLVMRQAGVIISSSKHEGTHESIAEGAAAGCVPVVRNWPDAAPWAGGARSIYPDEWVVESVDEAVKRIRSTSDPAVREAIVRDAVRWVEDNRRPEDVLPPYLDAILGR